MDEFAQTRAPDDLFDDDFVPIAEPVEEVAPAPAPPPPPEPAHAQIPRGPRGGRPDRGGRGRGRSDRIAHQVPSQHQPQQQKLDTASAAPPSTTVAPADADTAAGAEPGAQATGDDKQAQHKKDAAVRGDRSATGGVKKDKLTEEQLTERLNAMSLKNASLAAAHARAEADASAFSARESAAAVERAARQKQDRQNRQQMMGERERNRQRKLNALGGREWDAEKEENFAGVGEERRGNRRGAFGGVVAPRNEGPRSENARVDAADDAVSHSQPSRGRGGDRGRGGRGRGGRGRGRGGDGGPANVKSRPQQAPPTADEFPDLPAATKKDKEGAAPPKPLEFPTRAKTAGDSQTQTSDPRPGINKQESFGLGSPGVSGEPKSWADQVEAA
ncbi:hypothetical protein M501DRAFT_1006617 [Patellaria atrata CBS 101060]|uniref:Uncharacterized protein n=1 Tax=Patellaria atrata CBS 101060 TaxID=1346257 RepID=A0A9P4S7J9_9PEZI|nr:hypothetical protein M501DRAFT_1006617 [Patellaria atrata CBS 101060]